MNKMKMFADKIFLADKTGTITRYSNHGCSHSFVHYIDDSGYEWWKEFDEHYRQISFVDSLGYGWQCEYEECRLSQRITNFKDSNGYESWSEYDQDGCRVFFRDSTGRMEYIKNGYNPKKIQKTERNCSSIGVDKEEFEPFTFMRNTRKP